MILAYADESGDSGYYKSPTRAFILALVLVPEQEWLRALDRMVDMRRYMKEKWGIPPRAELKAHDLLTPRGAYRRLGLRLEDRLEIYRLAMSFQAKMKVFTTFAICIDKDLITSKQRDPRDFAWQFALERLDNYAAHQGEWIKLFPDAGHGYFIRRMVRRMRRFHRVPSAYGPGNLSAEALRIVEDPSDRLSHESYFIQLADLNAYAAHRYLWPNAKVDQAMWNTLGESRLLEVNEIAGGPPGVKVFPK